MSQQGLAGRQQTWFSHLFGFLEEEATSYEQVQAAFEVNEEQETIKSRVNGNTYQIGRFSNPTLSTLRLQTEQYNLKTEHAGRLRLEVMTGDVSVCDYAYYCPKPVK